MPIYEYKCLKCSKVSETWQKLSDLPLAKCPACGGRMEKIISMNAFHLKGSGWYTTDYASKNASTGKGCESASSDSDSGGCDCSAGDKASKESKEKASA